MPCEENIWMDRQTTACPQPLITNCSDCLIGLCSSHVVECDTCGRVICRRCLRDHDRRHERKDMAKPTRAEPLKTMSKQRVA
jgi:hypothetical protein